MEEVEATGEEAPAVVATLVEATMVAEVTTSQ